MKTVFIINPCAGQGNGGEALIEKIRSLPQENTELYITRFPGDATEYVTNFCKIHGGARFIACGGDGTLNEVLNGAVGFENTEVGIIPIGTGNDFCRNFDSRGMYEDISAQIYSKSIKCDAIAEKSRTHVGFKDDFCPFRRYFFL